MIILNILPFITVIEFNDYCHLGMGAHSLTWKDPQASTRTSTCRIRIFLSLLLTLFDRSMIIKSFNQANYLLSLQNNRSLRLHITLFLLWKYWNHIGLFMWISFGKRKNAVSFVLLFVFSKMVLFAFICPVWIQTKDLGHLWRLSLLVHLPVFIATLLFLHVDFVPSMIFTRCKTSLLRIVCV